MRFCSSFILTPDSLSLCTVFCKSSDCSSEELSDDTLLHLFACFSFLSSAVYDFDLRSSRCGVDALSLVVEDLSSE